MKQQNVMVSLGVTPPLMVLKDKVQISCQLKRDSLLVV